MVIKCQAYWFAKPFQFSIATVLFVILVAAVIMKFVSGNSPDSKGVKTLEWEEFVWVDDAVGIAERLVRSRGWVDCTAISGDGVYCILESGVNEIGTTGGGYYSIGIQLPSQMMVGDEVELHPITTDSTDSCKFHSMSAGDVVLKEYGNPTLWPMAPLGKEERIGKLRIVDIGDEAIVVELEINTKVSDWLDEFSIREFVISEEFKLNRSILHLPFYKKHSSSKVPGSE